MKFYSVKETDIVSIADAIRSKAGNTDQLSVSEMHTAIEGFNTDGGMYDSLVVTSYHNHRYQSTSSATAKATVKIPSNANIISIVGYTARGSNSKTYPCPTIKIVPDPSGIIVTEADGYKIYTLAISYGMSNYYNTVLAELIITSEIPGLRKRTDGADTILYGDSSLVGLPATATDFGDFTKADFSLTVTSIPPEFANGKIDFKSCIVHPECTSIGDNAFYGCTGLTLVSDDESVASGSVSLPSVTTLGSNAFYGCTKISTVSLPSLIYSDASSFENCTNLRTVSIPALEEIYGSMFRNCSSLESVDVASATSIGDYGFRSCTKLTEIIFSSNVTYLRYYCFGDCTSLRLIDLSHCTAVPYNGNIFGTTTINPNLQIKIPAALYDEWIADEDWSELANYIVAV